MPVTVIRERRETEGEGELSDHKVDKFYATVCSSKFSNFIGGVVFYHEIVVKLGYQDTTCFTTGLIIVEIWECQECG